MAKRGCNTRACVKRVRRKRMRRYIAPYRGWLASTRACESGNKPTAHSANGLYHGLYQFDIKSWYGAGGRGDPHNASRLVQSYRAVRWLKIAGHDAWPVCG